MGSLTQPSRPELSLSFQLSRSLPVLPTHCHAEAPEVATDPSLSLVTLTSSCSGMLLSLTTLTPLEPPQRLETACTTSPTPPPLLESLATSGWRGTLRPSAVPTQPPVWCPLRRPLPSWRPRLCHALNFWFCSIKLLFFPF